MSWNELSAKLRNVSACELPRFVVRFKMSNSLAVKLIVRIVEKDFTFSCVDVIGWIAVAAVPFDILWSVNCVGINVVNRIVSEKVNTRVPAFLLSVKANKVGTILSAT